MGKYTVTEELDRTIPEDTILRAKLVEVNEKTIEWKDRNTGEDKSAEILEWWFEITDLRNDGLWCGRKVKASCDALLSTHPANRFRNWSEALLGRELPQGAGIDPAEDLVGLQCDITVAHRTYKNKDGDDRVAEDLDEIMPVTESEDDVPF